MLQLHTCHFKLLARAILPAVSQGLGLYTLRATKALLACLASPHWPRDRVTWCMCSQPAIPGDLGEDGRAPGSDSYLSVAAQHQHAGARVCATAELAAKYGMHMAVFLCGGCYNGASLRIAFNDLKYHLLTLKERVTLLMCCISCWDTTCACRI